MGMTCAQVRSTARSSACRVGSAAVRAQHSSARSPRRRRTSRSARGVARTRTPSCTARCTSAASAQGTVTHGLNFIWTSMRLSSANFALLRTYAGAFELQY